MFEQIATGVGAHAGYIVSRLTWARVGKAATDTRKISRKDAKAQSSDKMTRMIFKIINLSNPNLAYFAPLRFHSGHAWRE